MDNKSTGYLATTNGDGSLIFVDDIQDQKDDPANCASDSYNNRFKNSHITKTEWGKDFKIMLDKFVKEIPSHGTVIDVGCGAGFEVNYFSSLGFNTFGIDVSEEIIRMANENHKGLNFICGNLHDLPIPSGLKIHGIYEHLALMNSYKTAIEEFLIKAFKLLEPKGVIQVSFEKDEAGFKGTGWYLVPFGNLPKDKDNRIVSLCNKMYLSYFTEDELRQLFKASGFKIIDFRCYKEPTITRKVITVLAKKKKTIFSKFKFF